MKRAFFFIAVVLSAAALAASAEQSFQGTLSRGAPVHPSQYSFADLYRATVAGTALPLYAPAPSEAPARVAGAPLAAQFSIAEPAEPRLGLLLLSGLALAAWVARRRLGYGQ